MIKFWLPIFLFFITLLSAQIEYGAKIGYNGSQHYGVKDDTDEYSVKSSFRHGFTGGLFLYLPITERFGLQYEANYVQKGSFEEITISLFDEKIPLDVIYETDYLDFPILFKYLFPLSQNLQYSAVSGTAMSLLVKNYYQLDGNWKDEEGEVAMHARKHNFAMEQFDFSFLYGGEIYYSWNNLDFFFDYRFTIGWNVLKMPTYVYLPLLDGEEELIDNSPVELKNQSYAFSIGILF